jgi:ElaB/YqjD/DUF883 family membrane-anchored ribosome-binding protein
MIARNDGPSLYTAYGPGTASREPLTAEDVTTFVGRVDEWTERHPGVCIALALSAGVALGWLIKRR